MANIVDTTGAHEKKIGVTDIVDTTGAHEKKIGVTDSPAISRDSYLSLDGYLSDSYPQIEHSVLVGTCCRGVQFN